MVKLPVTVLSGFLGSGKTTLLNAVLARPHGRRVAVIVNDMSEVNIDAQLISHTTETLVELTNGCICCTLRDDLLREIERLAKEKRFDYLLIESTGISEPLPVAATFAFETSEGHTLSHYARLDTMVTVVDGAQFLEQYLSARRVQAEGMGATPEDNRSLVHLLTEQVEFANVILISKTNLVSAKELDRLETLLRRLNPKAGLLRMVHGDAPISAIFDTNLFQMREAVAMPTWEAELKRQHTPETEEYGVRSFVYRARRPIHPERLWKVIKGGLLLPVLRSKGTAWIASRVFLRGVWSKAGRYFVLNPGQPWWATVPPDEWPQTEEMERYIETYWDATVGDCRQELVFIGIGMDEGMLRAALDSALLTDEELRLGPEHWASFPDPLPLW